MVDDGRAGGRRLGAGGGGDVGGQALDPDRDVGVAGPVDGPDPAATAGQLADQGAAGGAAGPDHDVQVVPASMHVGLSS